MQVTQDLDFEAIRQFLEDEITNKLHQDPRLQASNNLRSQVYWAYVILREETIPQVPLKIIARIFNLTVNAIKKHYHKYSLYGSEPGNAGHPSLLSTDEYESTIEFILQSFHAKMPITTKTVQKFIQDNFERTIFTNTLSHMFKKDDRLRTCTGRPMEVERTRVKVDDIQAYFNVLKQKLTGVPAHFIFNMDEMGHSDWADRLDKTVWVSSSYDKKTVPLPVSRNGKRITLVATIALDGSICRPLFIVPRKTIDTDLVLMGLTSEKITVSHQQKGFMVTTIFEKWFGDIFLEEILRRRLVYEYDGPAFLIIDGCTSHDSDLVYDLCLDNNIDIIVLPPHASNQLQMLDLSIFGITKRYISDFNKLDSLSIQSMHIAKIYSAFIAAALPHNIVESFRNGGIIVTRSSNSRFEILADIDTNVARCLLEQIEVEEVAQIEENEDIDDENSEENAEEEDLDTPLYILEFIKYFPEVLNQ
jgi:hypothetical protein